MPASVRRVAWLFGAVVLAGLTLRHWFGDELFVTRYTGYVVPWLLLGLLPLATWAWIARRRALSAVLGLSAAIVVGLHVPLFWRGSPASPPPGPTLEVMSYNTWSRNSDVRRIARVIVARSPDLLLLQEIRPEVFEGLMDALRELRGAWAPHATYDAAIQQAVVSRYPLEPRASMKAKGHAQEVVVRSPAGPITIFNVHALRTGGWRHRYGQIAALLEEDVLARRSPVILAGDLNVTEHSQLYALLARHLENAHRSAGCGFGFTYPGSGLRLLGLVPAPPLARIDHIFFSGHFVALRAGTVEDSGGSDHRPVFASLALRPVASDDARGRISGAASAAAGAAVEPGAVHASRTGAPCR